jgi:hypothetical protein
VGKLGEEFRIAVLVKSLAGFFNRNLEKLMNLVPDKSGGGKQGGKEEEEN